MFRQIPQETVFTTSDRSITDERQPKRCWVDPNKKNRYHFRYPTNWSSMNMDNFVIGIRDLYITQRFKHLELTIAIHVWVNDTVNNTTYEKIDLYHELSIDVMFGDAKTLQTITSAITKMAEENSVNFKGKIPHIEYRDEIVATHGYADNPNGNGRISTFNIQTYYNDLPEDFRTISELNDDGETFKIYDTYSLTFEIVEINDEARKFFHYEGDTRTNQADPIITYNVYDYNSCILYSSLSTIDDDLFLGHTRQYAINPPKYYEVKNSNKSFWVELYATSDHTAPVYLNDGDDLYIEAQLITTNAAII